MSELIRNARHATRRLVRTPLFTLATLLTLALGIGANTAIFSVVNGVLLRPLPFPEPDRLVGLWQKAPGVNIDDLNASIADYVAYREHSQTLADVAIWTRTSATVTGNELPERVDGLLATFRLLPMLGVQPALGRPFAERDDADGSPEVVMLGYGYWQRRFGGDPAVVGRRLTIDGATREVIGVLPRSFWFMDAAHDVVMPLRFDRAKVHLAGYNFNAVGRLKPGVTIRQIDDDVARMIALEMTLFPPPDGFSVKQLDEARLGPNVRPLVDDLVGDIGRSLWVIMATLGVVLLIACANVANLVLVRTESRTQELAVRAAIGAGPGRLAREMLVESLLLGLAAGLVGVVLAIGAVKLVLAMEAIRLPRGSTVSVDVTSLAFALALSVVVSVIFGAVPIVKRGRVQLVDALRADNRNASAGRDRSLTRNVLTMTQVALALVLLVGSGLMIRTFHAMRSVAPGFADPASLQTLRLAITGDAASDETRRRQLQHDLADRLAAIPGVTHVGLTSAIPMTGSNSQDPVFASDHTYAPNAIPPLRRFVTAAPGAFHTLGTPVVAGREYDWTDIHEKRQVAIVSDGLARELWGTAASAIGKRIRSTPNDQWSEIVGVVADVRQDGVDRPAPTTVYWPLRNQGSMAFLLRSPRAGSESLASDIRRAVSATGAGIPVTQLQTMAEIYDRSMARTAFTLTLLAISGGMALLLAVVGIYAVISYAVSQRTREIGIRLALGARHGGLQLMFVRHGLFWGALGVIVGLVVALPLSRLMSSLLVDVSPVDPLTYAIMGAGLLAAAVVASYVPARRVTRIDPVDALRSQ